MTRNVRSKSPAKPTQKQAPAIGTSVPGAHAGGTDLVAVLERVVPFLFRRKKKAIPAAPALKAAKKPAAVKKVSKKTAKKTVRKPVAKKASRPARVLRKPATVLEVRKRVKDASTAAKTAAPASLESADTADAGEAEDDAEETVTAAAATQVSAKPGKKSAGVILLPEEEKQTDAEAVKAELLAEAEDDAFLGKVVKSGSAGPAETKKLSGWALFKERFSRDKTPAPAKPAKKGEELTRKEIAEDTFLQRVQKKSVNSVVGTAVDPDEIAAQKILGKKSDDDALEEFASGGKESYDPPVRTRGESATKAPSKGRILSAADLRKEAAEAKEASARLEKEVKEIKEEMRAKQKDREKEMEEIDKKVEAKKAAPEQPAAAPVSFKKKQMKHKSGLQRFLAGIGHFGLGKERMHFVQNLATMLNAGLPLIDSLKTLQLETRAKPMKKLLQRILDAVENGSPLWRAMEAQSFFSLHALALIRIGEEAGNLAQNVEYLAQQEEKDHELKSKVKMAMIYPSIVMVIMFIIVMGLGLFVLPNLIGVLYSLNVPLPFVTRMVILFTNTFTEYGAIAVPGSIGFFILMIILAKFTPARGIFQWMMFRIPGIGALATDATIARFGVILGGLLKAGVPVVEAMQSLVEVTPIVAYRKLYIRLLDHVSMGDSFSKSFSAIKGSQKLLPPSVQQLVITGEKSGALADIMLKIADIYDKKASETAQKLPVILEPMLLLFIGGLVGTIAFAIIVPIYSIVGTVGR